MKKSVKVTISLILILCCLAFTLTACDKDGDELSGGTDTLVVYNWEDYIDTAIYKEDFPAYYKSVTGRNLNVVYTTYDTNETMMTKVLKGDANVDLICPSEYSIQKLMLAGSLLSHKDVLKDISADAERYGLSFDGMSSLGKGDGNIEPAIMNVIRPMFGALEDGKGNTLDMTDYMVPYFWGTLGILYNTGVISKEELDEYGWGVLWNAQNNDKLEDKILMKDSVRDTYAAAVFYMYQYNMLPEGYENYKVQDLINCTDDAMLVAAEKVLTEQRNHISGYEVDFGKDDMVNEIVYADLAWSGDAMYAIEEGDYDEETDTYQLGYYVPSIASNIWYDGWVIPKTVNNKLAAMMFIDYMCRPLSGMRNTLEVCYTSAVAKDLLKADEEACELLIENYTTDEDGNPILDDNGAPITYDVNEYFDDEVRYPEIGDTLGVMCDFGAKNDALINMWQRAKSGDGISPVLWWCLLAIALAAGLAIGLYFLLEHIKAQRFAKQEFERSNRKTST